MGRVIKGSPASPERYTIAIPAFVAPPSAAGPDDVVSFDDFDPFGMSDAAPDTRETATLEAAEQAERDMEAIGAQAQELIDDAARSADALVDDAREQARGLLEAATAQAEALRDDARRAGQDEGYAAGIGAAQAQMESMLSTMRDLLEATRNERHAIINAAEPELVRLAVGIAERVLHQQIALDHGVVVEMAKAAIARIVDREKITVRVNPADVDRMREHRDELLALGDVKMMRVIEDQRVDHGGVIIETDAGSIDAKISTQLAEVRKILHIVDDVVVQPAPIAAVDDSALTSARAS